MKILTIDTSTDVGSVAVTADKKLLYEELFPGGVSTTDRLASSVNIALKQLSINPVNLDYIGVATGPGSFTGIRVGIAFAKGLSYSTGVPVAGFSSLELLAMNGVPSYIPICPMADARKKEVYTALYRYDNCLIKVLSEQAADPSRFLDSIEGEVLFIGVGAVLYKSLILDKMGDKAKFAPDHLHFPRASAGAFLVQQQAEAGVKSSFELTPEYLRLPEAELNKVRKQL
ncbi:MAG: tRNA (adenosine(37)-N6)-threonylcarbamoyltransferase complex dimerization subunit type 1 TsaB [Desulfuromonadales bacterium]|nr:tRNA (adenosine(37)-N6)-threonylcarbamoyltransferase complex dimerization subunit type 1 TsaB [Desulfuromonadales bacterium]